MPLSSKLLCYEVMQVIEGVGNEVTGAFLVLSGIIGVCVYKLVSQWSNNVTYQEQNPQYPAPADEVRSVKSSLS